MKKLSLLFVSVACMGLIAHAVVPHHHHADEAAICFAVHNTQPHENDCADGCAGHSGQAGHDSGCEDVGVCKLNLSFISKNLNSNGKNLVPDIEVLPFPEISRTVFSTPVTTYAVHSDTGISDEIFFSLRPLRAPPAA